jgi:hypothetical protein
MSATSPASLPDRYIPVPLPTAVVVRQRAIAHIQQSASADIAARFNLSPEDTLRYGNTLADRQLGKLERDERTLRSMGIVRAGSIG